MIQCEKVITLQVGGGVTSKEAYEQNAIKADFS